MKEERTDMQSVQQSLEAVEITAPEPLAKTIAQEEDFETAAMPHLNALFRTATRVLGDRNEAEDLVQETYLQAWKSFHRFEQGTNCRAWLFKILFHVINHHRRKWFKFDWFTDGDEALENRLVYEAPVSEDLSDEEVLAALEKLPRHYREVILLSDVQEFSYKEISEILSIPIGTVMSRLSRGRKVLRDELAGFAAGLGIHTRTEVTEEIKA
jgi:RNA polymerase sigma-70 factor (ECF subfamily)